jgi:hypothetical protein
MKALVIVFTFTVLLLCVTPMAISEIVTIDVGLLPGSPQASYVHCWAAATNSTNSHVPFPGGRTSTSGSDINCDANKTGGGNSATAHSRARVTGGVLLEATVNASKVTFAAAAAYAQGGGQVKKVGVNKSLYAMVSISGLRVTGRQDPIDHKWRLEVTNLNPMQINQASIKKVVGDPVLLKEILNDITENGHELTDLKGEPYLEVIAEMKAEQELTFRVSAPRLCDIGKLKDAGVDVRHLSSPKVQEAMEKVLDLHEDFCDRQTNVVQTSSFGVISSKEENGDHRHVATQKEKELLFVIVIPNNTDDLNENNVISVNTTQVMASRTRK